jgi:hypothetical protein
VEARGHGRIVRLSIDREGRDWLGPRHLLGKCGEGQDRSDVSFLAMPHDAFGAAAALLQVPQDVRL